ncbi:MAG: hypothetical protein ACK4WH_08850 [Phycisphaerales bacterium]
MIRRTTSTAHPRAHARSARAAVLTLVLLSPLPARAQVFLRDRSPSGRELPGVVLSVDSAGVRTADSPSADPATARIIGWDRVRTVSGPPAVAAQPFLPLADRLWRARTRLERGDWLAASPILRELAPAHADQPGPTAALIFEGLLRCELARGAQAAALSAWFEWLCTLDKSAALTESGVALPAIWIGGTLDLSPGQPRLIDDRSALVPALPPMWLAQPAIAAAAASARWSSLADLAASQQGRSAALGPIAASYIELYTLAAKIESGQTVPPPSSGPQSFGPRLVRLIVLARCGDARQRESARDGLATLARGTDPDGPAPWVESWCRAAIGRSLIREADPALRVRGVIELLHVPARFSSATPDLAALALAEAASTLWDLGDQAGAVALKSELLARHPAHPASIWGGLDKVVASPGKATGTRESLPDSPRVPARERGGS